MAASNPATALRLRRFTGTQRLFHLGLVVLFMLLSVTGLGWMYIETTWGRALVGWFGGYPNTLLVHRIGGLVLLGGFVAQLIYLLVAIDWRNLGRSLLGPDSVFFHARDLRQFFGHLGWVLGIAKRPAFERWTWWEKFDYWAVWWGLVIVGATGLLIYNPVASSEYLPGWFYNIALWIHRIEAVLAMGHIFTVHFFVEHWRPANFPYNNSMFDGSVPLEEAREERAAWVARLEAEGTLQQHLVPVTPLPVRMVQLLFGLSMIGLGLFLLVGGLYYVTALTFFG